MAYIRNTRAMLVAAICLAAFMAVGMTFPQVLGEGEWQAMPDPMASDSVHKVDFVDETVGYVVTNYTFELLRTTNGGRTWEEITPSGYSGLWLYGLHFLDARTGWVVGSREVIVLPADGGVGSAVTTERRSVILHTEDGGESWTLQTIADQPQSTLNAIDFYDATHGFAVGDRGLSVATFDGGATWDVVRDDGRYDSLLDVDMTSPTVAHVVGFPNLAGTWEYRNLIILPGSTVDPAAYVWLYDDQSLGGSDGYNNAVQFTDAETGHIASGWGMLRTDDGGDTWTSVAISGSTGAKNMNDVHFIDSSNGWAAGAWYPGDSGTFGVIARTTDGGETWTHLEAGRTGGFLDGIDVVDDCFGWALGGSAYKLGATDLDRLSGANRYDTAIDICGDAFGDNSSDYVVVATGANFADALAAAGLAGAHGCPLLLTGDTLSSDLTAEIDRVGATNVVLVGGVGAIPQEVEDDLVSAGYTVDRIAGENRYDTAAKIAAEVTALVGPVGVQPVIVARGDDFADALAISPLAYSQKLPVLLVRPTSIPAETDAAFDTVGARTAILVGGTGAISQEVQDDIDVALAENGGIDSERWFGADRYETAAVIAENSLTRDFGSAAYIGVATGVNFPDALGGGVACGRRGGVLLLTSPTALSADAEDFITAYKRYDTNVRVFGGEGAVSAAVMSSIEGLF